MTSEQAVAWLILEGWVVVDRAAALRWLPLDGREVKAPRVCKGEKHGDGKVRQSFRWEISEFEDDDKVCPSMYPQYAVEVVRMIIAGDTD